MRVPILLFEDDRVDRLWPLAITNPAFDMTCGGSTLWAHLNQLPAPVVRKARVRPYLQPMVDAEFTSGDNGIDESAPWILVNARSLPTDALLEQLIRLDQIGQPTALVAGDDLVAAWLSAETPVPQQEQLASPRDWLRRIVPEQPLPGVTGEWLLRYPHDGLRCHTALLPFHMRKRIAAGGLQEVREGVYIGPNVIWHDPVATDTSSGPIVIEQRATVMPFVYLRGPAWIGADAIVQPHTSIKDSSVVGRHSRVGGEISGTILEPYSNKQHDGFLGNSYVSSWVNLGAGTTGSNLKNSYGHVRIQVGGETLDTGMQMFGCIIGSYVKTAILTRIMTGKLIGSNSVVYGTVSENVPDFVNYVTAGQPMTAVDLQSAITMQARMFARRGVEQQEYHLQMLRAIHQQTSPARAGLRQGPPQL